MAIVAGADGCPGGWICVTKDTATGYIAHGFFQTARELIFQSPIPAILMVDVPIGLSDGVPRECDVAARVLLGRRHVCVFPAPIRTALHVKTRLEACRVTEAINGRRVGCQGWAIVPKIREVDGVLSADPGLQDRVFEVHPEVSFYEWNGRQAFQQGKKTALGRGARQALIGRNSFDGVRNSYLVGQAGHDDIADAFAALWTAERKLAGQAIVAPAVPRVDDLGLRMEIWR